MSNPPSGLSISLQVADSEREQEPEEHDSDSDEETDLLPNARCRSVPFFFPFFPFLSVSLEKRRNKTVFFPA